MKVSVCREYAYRFVGFLLLFFVAAICPTAGNAGEENVYRPNIDRVTIEKKMIEAVITNVGDEYALSGETIIVERDGSQVSIRELLVPCEAEITYEMKSGGRTAMRIRVLATGRSANRHRTFKVPE